MAKKVKGMKKGAGKSKGAGKPGIEVHEVDDYTKAINFNPEKMGMWGCEFKYAKSNAYPIKTYVDYGLDKDPKEEYKVDPLAPLLEYLGGIGPNQQVWIQFIVRAHKDDQKKSGYLFKTADLWKEEAEAEVHKILGRDPKTRTSKGDDDDDSKMASIVRLSPGETDIVKAIERSRSKLAFDVGIRGIYMATKKENFVGTNIPGLFGSFKQFNTENLNSIKLKIGVWNTAFGDPWQDFRKIRENRMLPILLETYKRRMYFFPPYRYVHRKKGKPLVMDSEELATIFHFPGQVAATPTLARIPSKKSQAPANLPI